MVRPVCRGLLRQRERKNVLKNGMETEMLTLVDRFPGAFGGRQRVGLL